VTQVLDGDTFYCIVRIHKDGSISVRLYGIDAPEKDQPYGEEAKNSLKELVAGKTVRLEVKDRDKYGTTVALVYVGSLNVNLEQVKRGLAWAYLEYLGSPYISEYYSAEKEARSKGLGLWKQANPTPPWEWRKIKKHKEKVFY
jgi:endonuclease YncB( thermonuclease family)